MVRLWPNLVHTPADPWQYEAELAGYDWAKILQLSILSGACNSQWSWQSTNELTLCSPSWQLQYAETAHCGRADILQLIDDSGADMTTICTISRMTVEHDGNDIFIRQRPELVGIWLQVCQAISRRLAWAKMLASTPMCFRWFYAYLSCTRDAVVPVHISHVLVNVAIHRICSAGRPSTLGQQSADNLATIKYLNI